MFALTSLLHSPMIALAAKTQRVWVVACAPILHQHRFPAGFDVPSARNLSEAQPRGSNENSPARSIASTHPMVPCSCAIECSKAGCKRNRNSLTCDPQQQVTREMPANARATKLKCDLFTCHAKNSAIALTLAIQKAERRTPR